MSNYNQHQIITWLEDLIPEINETKDPEGVILKFASEQNLKPAVMEKLAQVFNTAKTLNYLDRTTEARGATFSLVDPESIVAKYTCVDTNVKSASVRPTEHSYENDPYKFPDIFGTMEGSYLDGDTSLENEGYSHYFNVKKAHYDKSVARANIMTLEQIAFDIEEDLRNDMYKLANIFRSQKDFDFEDFEKRAKALYPEYTAHIDTVADFLASTKLRVKRATEEYSGRLVKDNLGEIELFKQVVYNTELLKSANDLIKESVTATKPKIEPKPDVETTPERRRENDPSRSRRRENEHSGRGHDYNDPDSPWRDKADDKRIVINNQVTSTGGGGGGDSGGGGGNGGGGSGGGDNSYGLSVALTNIFDPITGGLLSGNPNFYGEKIMELFGGGINQKQLDVDAAAAQVRSEIALNTLLMTDPVIADADEELVREYFDTLSKVAPEVTRDINVLRSMLRQQVHFGGIDYPTVKDLSSTEKQLAEARELRRREIQNTYGNVPPGKNKY